MRLFEIEAKAIDILDRIVAGQPIEDAFVECKAEWPTDKHARQLAGHANAARGAPILWLIGVDLAAHQVVGVNPLELATWYAQISANFDGVAPSMVDVNVSYRGKTVVALWFETGKGAPFVARKDSGDARWDIPWRVGASTRSAKRNEILRLLLPELRAPDVEVVSAQVLSMGELHGTQRCYLRTDLWIVPRSIDAISMRLHDSRVAFGIQGGTRLVPYDVFAEADAAPTSSTIDHSRYQVYCTGPGRVMISVEFSFQAPSPGQLGQFDPGRNLEIELSLRIDHLEQPVVVTAILKPWPIAPRPQNMIGYWRADPRGVIH